MQKNKSTNVSVPIKYNIVPFEDDRFLKCKVLVMHDGLNLNGSVFKMDAIEMAKDSIKNIPILAFVKQQDGTDGADFGGHESETVIDNGSMKYRYLGRPIGVIPADACDYHYEIYDGKTFVAVTGYIYTDYANEALDILGKTGEKGQSMEIRVDDGEWDEYGYYNITSYRYTGVTILGDNVTPAMTGAKVQLFSTEDGSKFSDEYFAMVDELNSSLKKYATLSEESEVTNMDEEKELETTETIEEVVEEMEVVETEETVEETEEVVEEMEVVKETTEEEVSEEEVIEEVETNSVEETEEVETEEVTVGEDFSTQLQERDNTIFELNTKLQEITTRYETLESEVVELREYKRVNEAEKSRDEKEGILQDFSLGLSDEEIKPVRDEMDNLSVEQMKVQLNEIFTKKNLEQLKSKKFANNPKSEGIVMDVAKKENSKSKYAV